MDGSSQHEENIVHAELTSDLVAATVTTDSMAYLNKILLPGTTGDSLTNDLRVNPAIRDLVDAIYQVFAGSSVARTDRTGEGLITTITLNPTGNVAEAQEYKHMEEHCTHAINSTNNRLGKRIAMEF
jgi:hypothetical protein